MRDADTLPKGVGGILLEPALGYGTGGLERFGRGWQTSRESLIADYNGIDLTEVLAGDDADMIVSTIGSLGTTNFVGSTTSIGLNIMAAFGITDRLTVVALLPWMSVKYKLDIWLDPQENQSRYRVKSSDAITCPGGNFQIDDPAQLTEILEEGGANYKFNVGDLRRALVSKCLGYRDPIDKIELGDDGQTHGIANRHYSGFRDLIFGAKYQFFHGEDFSLAGIGYVIAPTGQVEDPNDLFDFNFGDGQWDAALLVGTTLPLGDFRLAASVGYEISFGDSLNRRLNNITFSDELEDQLARGEISEQELFDKHLDDANSVPIVTRFDQAVVRRKLGDTFYVYSGFSYQILEWLSVGITVDFLHHWRDEVYEIGPRPEGAPAYPTEAEVRATVDDLVRSGAIREQDRLGELRARLGETDGRKKAGYAWHTVRGNLVGGIGVHFNTLPMFFRGEFPLPIIAGISMNRHIAGQNLDTPDGLGLNLIIPFIFTSPSNIKDPAEYGYDDVEGQGMPWP